MALSGTISTTIRTHWRLSLSWSATQSVSNNTSTVTAKMYWESVDSYGAVYSNVKKYGSITIDGSSYGFSGEGLARLSPNQKKLIATKSKTIKHNADGTKSFSIDGWFNPDVDLGGHQGRIDLSAKTFTLDRIPRKSTMTSGGDFTAGSDRTISVSRASSSFSHKLYIDIKNSSGNWVNIKSINFSTSETSKSTSFSTDEKKIIFQALAERSSTQLRYNLHTLSGSTDIGYNTYYGTASRPKLSVVNKLNGQAGSSTSVYIDQNLTIDLTRYDSEFDHKVQVICGSFTKEFNGVGYTQSWTPSSSEQSTLYGIINNAISKSANIKVYTYYNGVRVGSTDNGMTYYVKSSINKPTFTDAGIFYTDTNPTTLSLTADDQYIIQGVSTLRVEIPVESKAVAVNGATMKTYSITVNGETKNVNYSSTGTVSADFGTINSASNATVSIKAIDSRGLSTAVTKVVKVVPYAFPAVSSTAKRVNGYEKTTTLTLKGGLSPIAVNGSNKNYLTTARYRYKLTDAATYGSWANFTVSGFPNYSATNVSLELDENETWDIQVEVSDALGVTTKTIALSAGRPILFLDAIRKSVGIGDFPSNENELKINGRISFGSTMWASQGNQGEGFGALFLNNSDISGANGIYFSDVSQNSNGEGLLFIKSGATSGSTNVADYDNLIVRDGVLYLNDSGSVMGVGNNLDMKNHDIKNVNHITINDPGGNEGIEWLGGSGWKIVEAPNDLSNVGGPLQFAAGGARQITFSPKGNVYIAGNTYKGESGGYTHFVSQAQARIASDEGAELCLHKDGTGKRIWSNDIYNRTYGGASANVYITGEGTLGRISSSAKYKMEIKEVDTNTLADRILNLKPKSWYDKAIVEALVNELGTPNNGEESGEEIEEDIPYLERYYGFIAEDLVEEGLEMFATYGRADENGNRELEGIAYDRLWILLVPLVDRQRRQIEELRTRLDQIEQTN
ncbi:tail fiber protein [Bacillus phage 035JT004]|nr:tail fiber protein [Bacillus phage 035JT004]